MRLKEFIQKHVLLPKLQQASVLVVLRSGAALPCALPCSPTLGAA